MKIVDARGLSCPQPVLMTLDAIKEGNGEELEVLVDTDTARENVLRAVTSQGWKYDAVANEDDDGFRVICTRE